jgi:mono/diheme cytochrome c family protein
MMTISLITRLEQSTVMAWAYGVVSPLYGRTPVPAGLGRGGRRPGSLVAFGLMTLLAPCLYSGAAAAEEPAVSVENGRRISIVGGCHDCHTEGYVQAEGVLDPSKSLKGSVVGFQGPWGTTYAPNLRLVANSMSEDGFVQFAQTFKSKPPMPWFNVRQMTENELRSLHRYIVSLKDPGSPAPTSLPPGEKPSTPFIEMMPQNLPQ